MKGRERIVLGSGKIYLKIFEGDIPTDVEMEAEENLLGLIQGGASLSYSAEFYTATDDFGLVTKKLLTKEEAVLKSGVMTWNGATLEKLLATARVTEDTTTKQRIVKIGGSGNYNGAKYIIHFLHKDNVDGDIRISLVGSNEAGLELAFAKDKETVINAEFKAQPIDSDGTLIIYKEQMEDGAKLSKKERSK